MAIDLNACLPTKLVTKSADTQLYRIGLLLRSYGPQKRHIIHNPILVVIISALFWCRNSVFILISNNDREVAKYFGDCGQMITVPFYLNSTVVFFVTLSLFSQIIYYFNDKKGIEPTFLRVFQVLAGWASPKSVGLTSEEQVLSLVKITKLALKCCKVGEKILTVDNFFFFFVCYLIPGYSIVDLLIWGTPNVLFSALAIYYMIISQVYQMFYFYILCYYLKAKMQSMDERIEKIKTFNNSNIGLHLKTMDMLFKEIAEYNGTYFSKYLLLVWLTFGSAIVMLLTMIIINESLPGPIMFIFVNATFVFTVIFLFVVFTASSVNYKAKTSLKVLRSFMIRLFVRRTRRKYTVQMFNTQIKIYSMIERLSKKKVGFSCWKLFTINYFRCYEILTFLILLLLKMLEMHGEK